MTRVVRWCLALVCLLAPRPLTRAAEDRYVVVVVWDGMRPDFVSPQHTPTLHQLASRGTFFRRHHSSFVSTTQVNGTALATGAHPAHGGILANLQYRPDLGWLGGFNTEHLDPVRRGDLLSGGRYLAVPTLPEILQAAGIATVVAGSKGVALLHDRLPRGTNAGRGSSVNLFRGVTLPRSVLGTLRTDSGVGPPPGPPLAPESNQQRLLGWVKKARDKALTQLNGNPVTPPDSRRWDEWTTRALTRGLWKESIPRYSLLWLSEPDASQHETSPGSPHALAALRDADKQLGLVLTALQERGVLDRTDVLVVSDHGFSTVDQGPDIVAELRNARFVAGTQFNNPEAGDVLVVYLGGAIFFHVFEHHRPTVDRLVEFLQGTDFAGVLFAAARVEGTFPLSLAFLDAGVHAPDVVVSMRWRDTRNAWGTPGMIACGGGRVGSGAHGSLSPYDLNNTLIAAGPSFRRGHVSEIPSGNIDVAPTVLAILGLPRHPSMDGRVLGEAMATPPAGLTVVAPGQVATETLDAGRELGYRRWRQTLTIQRAGGVVYLDRGNGESVLK